MELFGAAEVEKGLVDRHRLDDRRELSHLGAHGAPDLAVFRHVRADHDPVRTGGQRLEHRHCRAHAIKAGDVAAGEHDPTGTAANDDRTIGKVGPVAFFDRGIKGVTIDMRDRQFVERGMRDEAGRSAIVAALAARRRSGERAAIAAQRRYHFSSGCHSQAAPRTPLEAPWTGGSSRVTTRSEKMYRVHNWGTRS